MATNKSLQILTHIYQDHMTTSVGVFIQSNLALHSLFYLHTFSTNRNFIGYNSLKVLNFH